MDIKRNLKEIILAIVGIIVIILLFFCYFFFQFSSFYTTKETGYVITSEKVIENLKAENLSGEDSSIDYKEVEEDTTIYKRVDKYYLNQSNEDEVIIDFPLISSDGSRIISLSSSNKYIDENFLAYSTVLDAVISNGKLYDGTTLELIDENNYILISVGNSLYVTLTDITVKTTTDNVIPTGSIVYFLENEIRYYSYENGNYTYGRIGGIDLDNDITLNDNTYTYEEFLSNLSLIVIIDEVEEEPKEEEVVEETKEEEKQTVIIVEDDTEDEYVYVKPEVEASIGDVNTYTFNVTVNISDPAKRIATYPIIEVVYDGNVLSRKTVYNNGTYSITGLYASSTFTVRCYYTYRNESDTLLKKTLFEEEITTKSLDDLDPLELNYVLGDSYSDRISFSELYFSNKASDEILSGLYSMKVVVGDNEFNISSSDLKDLRNLKVIDYTTSATLTSNTYYNVTFKAYDRGGNELPINNNNLKVKTSKKAPTANITITETNLTYFVADISYENPDNIELNNLKYVLTDSSNTIISQAALSSSTVTFNNLDVSSIYTLSLYADFDLGDGKGNQSNYLLKSVKVTTTALSNLGFMRFNYSKDTINQNDVTYNFSINISNTDSRLLELLYKVYVNVYKDGSDEIFKTITISGDDIESLVLGEKYSLYIDGLSSNSTYTLSITTDVKQGDKVYNIKGLSNMSSFTTLKQDASIEIINSFTTENLIDFDVRVSDVDGAILSDRVILQVRDNTGSLVLNQILELNADYVQITMSKLDKDVTYTFTYTAETYNLGTDNSTLENDQVLLKKEITTTRGVYGEVQIESLLKNITSSNLFDISSNSRWRMDGGSSINSRVIDSENEIITLAAKNGYANYSYYLPEGAGMTLTVSFYIRYQEGSNNGVVYLSNGAGSNTGAKLDVTEEWQYVSYNVILPTNYYIGFYITETSGQNKTTTIEVKELSIEIAGSTATDVSASYYDSTYIFKNTKMISGSDEMPTHDGTGTMVGNIGNGFAKITNLSTNDVTTFEYTGNYQSFVLKAGVTYQIECWGASGGYSGNYYLLTYGSHPGRGAYTSGEITLTKDTTIYIYVGQSGTYGTANGKNSYGGPVTTWNGGGSGGNSSSSSGGGATDIRLTSGDWDDSTSLKSRIMVAGAGGGTDDAGGTLGGTNDGSGGSGGTTVSEGAYINGVLYSQYAAGQLPTNYSSQLGIGGNVTTNTDSGGGGGGYYGGAATSNNNGGGAGGSSYISGHNGCISYSYQQSMAYTYSKYTESDLYTGTFSISIYDSKDELENKNFYIFLYNDGVEEAMYEYDMENENYTEDLIASYDFKKNTTYEVRLSVKVRDRYYQIDSMYFTTEDEIRTIKTIDDFFSMHTSGKYLVVSDLDFRDISSSKTYSAQFHGTIDFQGHKILLDTYGAPSYLMYYIQTDAVLMNMDVHYYLNHTSSRTFYGLFYELRGTVTNIKITIEEATDVANNLFSLISYVNRGTVENFVINNKAVIKAQRWTTLGSMHNYGVMKNGYVYGEAIDASTPTSAITESKRVGALAGYSSENSSLSNIYSTIEIIGVSEDSTDVYDIDSRIGSIIGECNRCTLNNIYSYTSGENRNLSRDANIGNYGTVTANNVYYVSDDIYSAAYSLKVPKLALKDTDFQSILNADNMFLIDDYVTYGYYPHIIWPDSMPNQEYVALPTVDDADLVDIISVKDKWTDGSTSYAVLQVNNPSNEKISDIKIAKIGNVEIVSQEDAGNNKSLVTVKLTNPTNYLSSYSVTSITAVSNYGVSYTREYDSKERVLQIDLYREINNLSDWKLMNTYPSENFILQTDLDFGNVAFYSTSSTSTYVINKNFYGKLDGNGHTISNINMTGGTGIIQVLYGSISNLYVENVVREESSIGGSFGVVGYAYNGSKIDNVHVKNITLDASTYMGGIVGYANGLTITNSSVSGVTTQELSSRVNVQVGGLIGISYYTTARNCYVQGIDFDLTNAASVLYVGGAFGYSASGNIDNIYTVGSIKTSFSNVGGISGRNNAYISNVISVVDLTSTADYIGGIAGYADSSNITNSLVIGSIYASDGVNMKRIAGNLNITSSAYAWEKQLVNGVISSVTYGETLLTTSDLSSSITYTNLLNFDSNFDYSDIQNKIPKLVNSETLELLPNQTDVTFEENELKISSITIDSAVTNATVGLIIDNPSGYKITGFTVNGATLSNVSAYNSDGITIINNMLLTPTKYYDSYMLTEIKYIDNDGNSNTLSTSVRLEVQFFKDISSYTDWQSISTTDAENYRLVGDIDLTGYTNVKTNVIFNRLISSVDSDGNYYSIIGAGYSKDESDNAIYISGSNNYLIKSIVSELTNVSFKNIIMKNKTTSSLTNNGLIGYVYGTVSNVNFDNITLDLSTSSYVGMIVYDYSNDIKNVTLNDITVNGRGYVGGFIAYSFVRGIAYVDLTNVTVTATANYAGGMMAYGIYVTTPYIYHVTGEDVTVSSTSNYVGGIFGYGGGWYIELTNATVTGVTYVGGIMGQQGAYNVYYNYLHDSDVTGSGSSIGGIGGYASYQLYYAYVTNSNITATSTSSQYVGGIKGFNAGYNIYYSGISDSTIISAGDFVGGITGSTNYSSVYSSYVKDTYVEGRNYVGGIAGKHQSTSNTIARCETNATVVATGTGAGGILGYAVNANTDDTVYKIYIYQNIVANSTITASTSAGGLIGYADTYAYDGHMYSNVISANIYYTSSSGKGGFVVGNSDYYGTTIKNTRIYTDSKLNGEVINTTTYQTTYLYDSNTFINATELATQATYTDISISTSYFDFSKLSTGYFPSVKLSESAYIVYFPLPTTTLTSTASLTVASLSSSALLRTSCSELHVLPTFNIYTSGYKSFNIEFDDIDEESTLIVNGESYVINKKVFTFNYNYQDDITIIITDNLNNLEYTYSYSDIQNKAYVYENYYYFISDDTLVTNNTSIDDLNNVVNIYDNIILYSNGDTYDINTKTRISNIIKTELNKDTYSLYSFIYNDSVIETYYNYSTIDDVEIDNIMYVKNSEIQMISGGSDSIKQSIVMDSYNNNEYFAILSTEGYIYNIKEKISYPNNFYNKEIIAMSNNLNSNTYLVAVLYEDGSMYVFDYRNGNTIYSYSNSIMSLSTYFTNYVTTSEAEEYENSISTSYSSSQNLIEELNETNISTVLIDDSSNSSESIEVDTSYDYISVYNSTTKTYEVYDISSLTSKNKDIDIEELNSSVTTNIKNNYTLYSFYNMANGAKSSSLEVKEIVIYTAILIGIIVSSITLLFVLRIKFIEKES